MSRIAAITWFVGTVMLAFIAGCASIVSTELSDRGNVSPVTSLTPLKFSANPKYAILPGDEIEIKLLYHPEYNERIEVLPDGKIYLPLLQEVTASGKSISELAGELKHAYGHELKNPEVAVILRRSSGRLTYVGGEVRNPQAIPLTFPITLLQAVIRCGDVLASAHEENVLILRTAPNAKSQAMIVNLRDIRSGELSDVLLDPYDVVYVPKTVIAHLGDFVEAYFNKIIPRSVSFPFMYQWQTGLNN